MEKKTDAQTKFEAFSSRIGVICRFRDYNLPRIDLIQTNEATIAIPSVRVVTLGHEEKKFFFHIEMVTEYHSDSATIEYSDFQEMLMAFDTLQSCEIEDSRERPDYLENHFVTEDGFKIGYYISGGKTVWFLNLSRYGTKSSLYMNEYTLRTVLDSVQNLFNKLSAF